MKRILKLLLGIFLIFGISSFFIFIIHYVFVYSFQIDEYRIINDACEQYVNKRKGILNDGLSSFVSEDKQYYVCDITTNYEKIVIIDENSNRIIDKAKSTIENNLKDILSEKGSFYLYNGNMVYKVVSTKDKYNVKYYDIDTGDLVFKIWE